MLPLTAYVANLPFQIQEYTSGDLTVSLSKPLMRTPAASIVLRGTLRTIAYSHQQAMTTRSRSGNRAELL